MSALENTVTEITTSKHEIQEVSDKQSQLLKAQNQELEVVHQRIRTLEDQQQEQAAALATTQEKLRNLHLHVRATAPATPRSEVRGQASSSNDRGTSALHSMIEGTQNNSESQQNLITELQRELTYTRREREELKASLDKMVESPHSYAEGILPPSELPKAYTSPRTFIYHQFTLHIPPFTSIMQCYQAMRDLHLLVSKLSMLKLGILLSKPQLERLWTGADATAQDTIVFMWATWDLRLPTGIIEVVTGLPPFYIGRFILRILNFISHHHSTFHKTTPMLELPTLKAHPHSSYHQIRELVKSHPMTGKLSSVNVE